MAAEFSSTKLNPDSHVLLVFPPPSPVTSPLVVD